MRKSFSRLVPQALFAVLPLTVIAPASAERWEVLIQGNPAGFMEIETPRDGEMQCHFEFNDRGRGPNLDTQMVLGDDGLPRKITTTGNDYMKGTVDESFSWRGGAARWQNSQEQGERLGTIEIGKLADLILVDGDPLTDMSDIRKVVLTVKNGTIHEPAEMYQAIGVTQ